MKSVCIRCKNRPTNNWISRTFICGDICTPATRDTPRLKAQHTRSPVSEWCNKQRCVLIGSLRFRHLVPNTRRFSTLDGIKVKRDKYLVSTLSVLWCCRSARCLCYWPRATRRLLSLPAPLLPSLQTHINNQGAAVPPSGVFTARVEMRRRQIILVLNLMRRPGTAGSGLKCSSALQNYKLQGISAELERKAALPCRVGDLGRSLNLGLN